MDRPDFTLSEYKRIAYVHVELGKWMTEHKIELYEVKRAIAMAMRLDDERKTREALERRSH